MAFNLNVISETRTSTVPEEWEQLYRQATEVTNDGAAVARVAEVHQLSLHLF
jgi:hypothetical protein